MIQPRKQNPAPVTEPETGRPAGTGEEWLGRNRSSKRRLWERLNPRSRKQIHVIAQALALQQTHAQLPEPLRARLSAAVEELERHVGRIRALLAEVARRTPRGEGKLQPVPGGGILSIWLSPINAAPSWLRHSRWCFPGWRYAPGRMRFNSKTARNCTA